MFFEYVYLFPSNYPMNMIRVSRRRLSLLWEKRAHDGPNDEDHSRVCIHLLSSTLTLVPLVTWIRWEEEKVKKAISASPPPPIFPCRRLLFLLLGHNRGGGHLFSSSHPLSLSPRFSLLRVSRLAVIEWAESQMRLELKWLILLSPDIIYHAKRWWFWRWEN